MEKLREAKENLHELEVIMTTKVNDQERNTDKTEQNHADEVQQLKLQLEVRQPYYKVYYQGQVHAPASSLYRKKK